jgi:type IV pilus assembly protein PilQ
MTLIQKFAAGALAAALFGSLALAAPSDVVRLVGVSSQAAGKSAAVLIESTEPVAYAVSRPDAMTVLVDLRNVRVADAAPQITRTGPLAGVTLEQATANDGKDLARVRVTLAAPAAYTVHSDRNVIRLDLQPDAPKVTDRSEAAPAAPRHAADSATVAPATTIDKIRAAHTRTTTTVTITGNGRLSPSSLTESDDQPRRLVLDFPNVSPSGTPKVNVDGTFVKQVHVALNSRDPLVTRVVMEISPTATYHVERAGADGRDLAVVFEGPKSGDAILVLPPADSPSDKADKDSGDVLTMAQALANGAALTPKDPIAALLPSAAGTAAPSPVAAKAAAQPVVPADVIQASQPQAPVVAGQPSSTQTVPGTSTKQYTGQPVSFDFEDSDLRVVLRLFSQISGLNMIIDPQVQGRVNVVLTDVPWDQALEQILRSNKLGYSVDGNIMRIAPLSVLADEQSQTQKLNDAKALAGELLVRTFPLSYAKADIMAPLLTKSTLSPRGQIQFDLRTNTLIVMDLPERLPTVQSLISELDRPQPQVEVQARVVQTTRDFARALGIQWGFNGRSNAQIGNTTNLAFPNNGSIGGAAGGTTQTPNDGRPTVGAPTGTGTVISLPTAQAPTSGIGLALGSINGAFNIDVALTALENTGKGRVLSEPRLTTQNNQQAVVRQGVQIPVQTLANNTVTTTFVNADLSLTVTPQITVANTVIMNISLTNSSPDFTHVTAGTPAINSQSATTTVQVTDGSTTVIGGIFVSEEQSNNDRTPYLYRVPIIKWLFQRNSITDSSRELLIFITPRILRG